MTIEVLYELMKQGFEQVQGLTVLILGLTTLMPGFAMLLKGRRLAFKEWIPIGC